MLGAAWSVAGLLLGLAAWRVAQHYAAQGAVEADAAPHADGSTGAAPVPAAAVAAAMALFGGYAGWRAPGAAQTAAALAVTSVLVSLTLVALQTRRLPNALNAALGACALVWAMVQQRWLGRPDAVTSLMAGALGAGGAFMVLAIVGRGALGMGDVKLAAALGALLGYPLVLPGLLLGVIVGGVWGAVLLITRRAGRKDYMPYGPSLALGAWIVYLGALGLWP